MQRLFIVGCPRSGTTMLQQALNRHSRIVIPPETKFFSDFHCRSLRHQRRHWRRIQEDLQVEQAAPTCRVCTPSAARSVYDELAHEYLARLGREGADYFGDKTPEHTSRLHWIEDVFPDAKMIFLVRDGRDVALSLSKTPWMHCDAYAGFLIWLYYYRMLRKTRATRRLDVYFARYESIVAQPEFELRRVLQFLNLPYEEAVAHGHGNVCRPLWLPDKAFFFRYLDEQQCTLAVINSSGLDTQGRYVGAPQWIAAHTDVFVSLTESRRYRVFRIDPARLKAELAKLRSAMP